MSGTSMDGVDVSIIKSDGDIEFKGIFNKYFEYNDDFTKKILKIRDKINNSKDLELYEKELNNIEKEITLFHSKVTNEAIKETNSNIDIIGFHGQTIFHNAKEKVSKQLGDGNLLSQETQKKVVYDFRQNDLKNGGEGAPLAPIFHRLISKEIKVKPPLCLINIGGIANITSIESGEISDLRSQDIGPGNCLIDEWIKKNTDKKFDKDGLIAKSGKKDKLILNQALDNNDNLKKNNILSYDIKDFDLSFVRGLSLEDGAATVTEFTGKLLADAILNYISKLHSKPRKILICGGGRKNLTLINCIKANMNIGDIVENIDIYGVDGDFIESQAFAYLAIRSFLNLPISFPKTTGCIHPCTGGKLVNNF
tara:strand:- start:156 stop:1253 length:1098 start_codon:yes stop_codon:yes gene_type:complete